MICFWALLGKTLLVIQLDFADPFYFFGFFVSRPPLLL
uniref:Uncharacterized protein n=1 Tax=Rhizophora mucronata TaxID=61149 RepID=A0A2P2PWJ9_RHIMU